MKKPTCLILVGIGVLLLIGVIVFVVPIFVDIFEQMQQMGEKQAEHTRALRQKVNEPLSVEQEKLLSQLLQVKGETSNPLNPENLEEILSTEPYLTYIQTQNGEDYADFPTFVTAMPTLTHRNTMLARFRELLGSETDPAELEIWVNYYYIMRDWSKTGKDVFENKKEFDEHLQEHLVNPIMEKVSGTKGVISKTVNMGVISTFMVEDNEIIHSAWRSRVLRYGTQEGYLRSAIATPTEFALMRSFFEDAATFEKWLTEPFRVEEDTEGQENK